MRGVPVTTITTIKGIPHDLTCITRMKRWGEWLHRHILCKPTQTQKEDEERRLFASRKTRARWERNALATSLPSSPPATSLLSEFKPQRCDMSRVDPGPVLDAFGRDEEQALPWWHPCMHWLLLEKGCHCHGHAGGKPGIIEGEGSWKREIRVSWLTTIFSESSSCWLGESRVAHGDPKGEGSALRCPQMQAC